MFSCYLPGSGNSVDRSGIRRVVRINPQSIIQMGIKEDTVALSIDNLFKK